MHQSRLNRSFAILTAITVALIVYGSLYPFVFRRPIDDMGPLRELIESWAEWHGRADFLSNIMLYMPLGFFAVLASRGNISVWKRLSVAIVVGGILSVAVELIQHYDEGRSTAAIDSYSNMLGTGFGAVAGWIMTENARWPFLRETSATSTPILLLALWIGYRLFPYVPIIDVHKYWLAVEPIFLHTNLTAYDLLRDFAMWLTVGVLVEAAFGRPRFWLLFPLLAGSVMVGEVLISRTQLSVTEMAAAGLAVAWFSLAGGIRLRITIVALVLGIALILERLKPFQFGPRAGDFEWIPFLSLVRGSESDLVSFLRKVFLYGSLIWLLVKAGLQLSLSAGIVAAALFITDWAKLYLPDRPAGVTDALTAIAIAGIIAVMDSAGVKKAPTVGSPEHPRAPPS